MQLRISSVILQQQSHQKIHEGLDKLHPFLSTTVTSTLLQSQLLSHPFLPVVLEHVVECRVCWFGPCLPRDWVKPSRSSKIAVNLIWKADTMVGATEQDLKIDGVIVLQRFDASCFSLPHGFSLLGLLPPPC